MFTPFQLGATKLKVLLSGWFLVLAAVAFTSWAGLDHGTDIASAATDPLLHSGSLVIAALLLLIGILLVIVVTLYRDNKMNNAERQAMALQTLQVLTDLEKTIQANTEARVRVGG